MRVNNFGLARELMMRISLGRGEERNQHDSGVFLGNMKRKKGGRVRWKLWRGVR